MAACTADLIKHCLTEQIRVLHRRIVRDHAARNGHCGLKQGDRGEIGYRQLVSKPVSIGVGIEPEALLGLHPMVMVERIVAELPQGNHVAHLM